MIKRLSEVGKVAPIAMESPQL